MPRTLAPLPRTSSRLAAGLALSLGVALVACVEPTAATERAASGPSFPPIQLIDFEARDGGDCAAGAGITPAGIPTWYPTRTSVPACPAGATDCLTKVVIDQAQFPDARCNDGSAAIMYVRGNPNSRQWLIHLQEGGSCSDYASCQARWCGTEPFDASKMSSYNEPDEMDGVGAFADRADNPFQGWNVVYGYYCSSDSWRGTAGTVGFQTFPAGAVKPLGMSLEFHGAAIVDAFVATLQSGVVVGFDGEPVGAPDLDRATTVVFTGSSAGAMGVRHHVDAVAARLRASNPAVVVRAVVDSTHKPMAAWATDALDGACDGDELDDFATSVADYEAKSAAHDAITGAIFDASCLAIHAADPQRCSNEEHVLHFHVSTPFFARQGLLEKLPDDDGDKVPDVSATQWKEAARTVLTSYGDAALTDPTTGEAREPMLGEVGWFGPDCRSHTALDTLRFYDEEVNLVAGGTERYASLVGNWIAGVGRHRAFQRDRNPPLDAADPYQRRSTCPDEPVDATACEP